jgi:hypothetical protein
MRQSSERGYVGLVGILIVVAITVYLYATHSPLVPAIPGMGTSTPPELSTGLNAVVKSSQTQKNVDQHNAEIDAALQD